MCDVDAERSLMLPNGSILMKLDRFRWALAHAGPALNTILRVDRIGLVSFDFKNFAGTDFGTIPAAIAFFLIDDRIHGYSKFQISNYKSNVKNPAYPVRTGKARWGFPARGYRSYCAPLPRLSRFGGTRHVPAKNLGHRGF